MIERSGDALPTHISVCTIMLTGLLQDLDNMVKSAFSLFHRLSNGWMVRMGKGLDYFQKSRYFLQFGN